MTDDEKKKLMGKQFYNPRIEEFNPTIDEDKVKQAFENKTIIADGQNVNEVSYIVESMTRQAELHKKKCIVNDIIASYMGRLEWNEYLKSRQEHNRCVRESNNRKIVNFSKDESAYKVTYEFELPILDFETFMIAERLGQLGRKEDDNKDVL